MKKLAVLCIAALGAALLVLGTAPTASAYPELTCSVTVAPQSLKPGHTFTVTGSNPVAVDSKNQPIADADVHWTFRWDGVVKTRTGKHVSAEFTAPQVSRTRHITLKATSSAAGTTDCVHSFDITVIGAAAVSAPTGNGLPSTGGPAFWVLVAGLVLLLGGGGAVIASRRRN